ncbi:hypothetical protein NAT51_11970 [Flavobacterium amniphilum]|uniref:hypothetical protein n=1 Tax=Flavobacterium amniphilum TaxID=1834035 RepID=UPI00202A989B|nr:hypothetical protein [Flavobacterium amniphilum]MCL9806244.1 hypothetical protein [Flavobacterium amniphilum]
MKRIFLGIISSLFLLSCSNDSNVEHVERAFYYWKGNSSINEDDAKHLNDLKVRKLYVKLFEVDYTEARGNFPFEKSRIDEYEVGRMDSVKVVPTIFIKNGIFQYNDEKTLDQLADNIVYLIEKYSKNEYGEDRKVFNYDEIQIDCDWTKSTKDKYFYLLKKIKSLSGKEISCTLRLYPYKYPDIMGVPPVDKVTLMCYNLIKPLTKKDKNSILDIEELKKYLNERKSYPVHIDVALPVFYWTQLYQNNRFAELLEFSTNDVKTFAKNTQPLWYQIERDTSFNYGETYLKAGDQIKCEDVKASDINLAIELIKKYVDLDKTATISLFDLDENTFKQYTHEEISGFYSGFTK